MVVDEERILELYSAMIGFRNRVVHGYQTISSERVYEISSTDLEVFAVFIRRIRSFLNMHN